MKWASRGEGPVWVCCMVASMARNSRIYRRFIHGTSLLIHKSPYKAICHMNIHGSATSNQGAATWASAHGSGTRASNQDAAIRACESKILCHHMFLHTFSSSAVSDCGLMPCLGKSILPLRNLMQVFSYSPFTPKSMLLKGLTVAC